MIADVKLANRYDNQLDILKLELLRGHHLGLAQIITECCPTCISTPKLQTGSSTTAQLKLLPRFEYIYHIFNQTDLNDPMYK